MNSRRVICIALLGITITLGPLSRSFLFAEPSAIYQYAGDALWALAVFWSLAALFPRASTPYLATGTLIIAFTIEASQLYHAGWIDHLRNHRIGALILGFHFRWADLACYTAGALLGATIDSRFVRNNRQSPTPS